MYIVQLYKEDWVILHMLGCRAVALPSTERILLVLGIFQWIWSANEVVVTKARIQGPTFIHTQVLIVMEWVLHTQMQVHL